MQAIENLSSRVENLEKVEVNTKTTYFYFTEKIGGIIFLPFHSPPKHS